MKGFVRAEKNIFSIFQEIEIDGVVRTCTCMQVGAQLNMADGVRCMAVVATLLLADLIDGAENAENFIVLLKQLKRLN